MNLHYIPGEYPLFQNESLVLLIVADSGDLPLAEIESVMGNAKHVGTVLDYLAGFGVSELPPFFLWQRSTQHIVILRGNIQVTVVAADATETQLTATHAVSWHEYSLPSIQSLRVDSLSPAKPQPLSVASASLSLVSELQFLQADESTTPDVGLVSVPVVEAPPMLVEPAPAEANAFEELFGATIYGEIELAAVRDEVEPDVAAVVSTATETERPPLDETSGTYAFNGSDVSVAAQLCPYGHPNPVGYPNCWQCRSAIPAGPTVQALRPSLGWLEFHDGKRIPLDRNILIGRNPAVHRLRAEQLPKLVTVDSPNQDISRNHLSVMLDGWRILLDDLQSTNGSQVVQPDGSSFRLIPGQPYTAQSGARVQLGDGVEFWVNGVFA